MEKRTRTGHFLAAVTMLLWGTTFIATKILLKSFTPVEILFVRFLIGFFVLTLIYPHRMKGVTWQQEKIFVLAGLTGACLYYLLENVALTYTFASNVGVIISVAPFFTALLAHITMRQEEKFHRNFFGGFAVAMVGICLISFNGTALELNPLGDFLSVLAAFVWACYSTLTKKISGFGYNTIQTTRRIFAYGILFMIPALLFFGFEPEFGRFLEPINLFNLLFLGIGASAICFVTWNFAVKVLGAVKTSVYIYIGPVITVITSAIILHEKITITAAVGTALTLAGLVISEWNREK